MIQNIVTPVKDQTFPTTPAGNLYLEWLEDNNSPIDNKCLQTTLYLHSMVLLDQACDKLGDHILTQAYTRNLTIFRLAM
jgi:hypothetical protein